MKGRVSKIIACLSVVVLFFAGISILLGNRRNAENYIDKAVSYYCPEGAEIVLIQDGKIDKILNYGYSDIEQKRKVNNNTQFKIASISKVFTAYAIMQLVDDGVLDLDVPVNTYLSQWQVPKSEYGEDKVTLRTLLCHTSGLSGSDALGYTGENPGVAATLAKDEVHLLHTPGTQFVYLEATGLGICQLVIEETTGISFSDYMQQTVFDKLGMTQTSFTDDAEALATPYAGLGKPVSVTHYVLSGASSITTTGEDMAKFALELMRYQQSGAEMFEPQELAGGAWCLGISSKTFSNGKVVYEHNGTLTGWNAQLAIEPTTQSGLIVLTNSDKAYYMTYQLMEDWGRYVLGEPIVDENVTAMAQMIKNVLLVFGSLLIFFIVWNCMREKKNQIVKKNKRDCILGRTVSSIFMTIVVAVYMILFYTPLIFEWLYQMPNYYLFSFFPPIIHWLLFEIIVFAGIVIWRSGYKRKK